MFAFPGLCCDRWLLLPGLPCSLALCVDGWAALWVRSVDGKVNSRRHKCLLWENRVQWRLKCLCPKSARFGGSCALSLEHSKGSKKPQYQSGLKCICWVLVTITFWQLFIFFQLQLIYLFIGWGSTCCDMHVGIRRQFGGLVLSFLGALGIEPWKTLPLTHCPL